MIANLSPNPRHFDENFATLEWASKASKITVNNPVANVNLNELIQTINILKKELENKDTVLKEKEMTIT